MAQLSMCSILDVAALASQREYPDLNKWSDGVDADEEVCAYAVIALLDAKTESKKAARTFFNQSPSQQGTERNYQTPPVMSAQFPQKT